MLILGVLRCNCVFVCFMDWLVTQIGISVDRGLDELKEDMHGN
jgi:hypothetical protein